MIAFIFIICIVELFIILILKNAKTEFHAKEKQLKEDYTSLKLSLEEEYRKRDSQLIEEYNKKLNHITLLRKSFEDSYISGRKWLINLISEAEDQKNKKTENYLRFKKRPAPKAADIVKQVNKEKNELLKNIKFLQYQLESYKEYFPFLEEYEDIILQEAYDFRGETTQDDIEKIDPVHKYLPLDEYNSLTSSQRNQLALDRYLSSSLDNYSIGRLYEMYLGFIYTKDGWDVQYHGIQKQKQDLGRDLICEKDNTIHIVQAKCWSHDKLIHEKHIFQLFGTTFEYKENYRNDLYKKEIIPVFITTTTLSDVARSAADLLGIRYRENFELQKNFPMIKCNINKSTGEKIYHLPFDQQYNRTVITTKDGEFYALTVAEAEKKGFRRAFRHYIS